MLQLLDKKMEFPTQFQLHIYLKVQHTHLELHQFAVIIKFIHSLPFQGSGVATSHSPQLILNNFDTKLGRRVARQLACLFPQQPNFRGRQVVTFHNQRDFIFVRFHRYIYDMDEDQIKLQELGPRFTLKLRSIQLGLFGDQTSEYQYMFKVTKFQCNEIIYIYMLCIQPKQQVNRKKFHL